MKRTWSQMLSLLLFVGLVGCGGGGSGSGSPPVSTPKNTAPTANFALSCGDLVCTFTNVSFDGDVGDSITAYTWTFGDGSVATTTKDAQHTFAVAGSYDVTLSVTDGFGATGTKVIKIPVTAPVPPAPHASFTATCLSLDCTFTDTSTYVGSNFQSRVWNFGDGPTAPTGSPVTHSYAVATLTTFTVKLTVTDAAGKTSTSIQSLPVTPPASTVNCIGANCVLKLTVASTVTATMVSNSCGAHGNQFMITVPVAETLFADGCYVRAGTVAPLNGGAVFAANTELQAAVISGLSGTTGLATSPAIRLSGDFASGWTLVFDDGAGGSGEPDFNDLVILIRATPKP